MDIQNRLRRLQDTTTSGVKEAYGELKKSKLSQFMLSMLVIMFTIIIFIIIFMLIRWAWNTFMGNENYTAGNNTIVKAQVYDRNYSDIATQNAQNLDPIKVQTGMNAVDTTARSIMMQ